MRHWLYPSDAAVTVTGLTADEACPVTCASEHTCTQLLQANATSPVSIYTRSHDVPLSTFSAEYTATAAGHYTLELTLRGQIFREMPVAIVPAAVEPPVCTVEADRLRAPLVYWLEHDGSVPQTVFIADETTAFAVSARDRFSNRLLTGGTEFEGIVMHERFDKGSLHEYNDYNETAEVVDYDDGTYMLLYNATVAGEYSVTITVEGALIANNPFRLDILPAVTSARTSVVKRTMGTSVIQAGTQVAVGVWAYDRYGNFRGAGGDDINVRVICLGAWWENPRIRCMTDGSDDVPLEVSDLHDGTYRGTGIITLVGNYSITVFLGNETVHDGAVPLNVYASASSARNSIVSAGIVDGAVVAGTDLEFEVQVVDDYGNRNLEGLARVQLEVVDYLVDMFTGQVREGSDQAIVPAIVVVGEGRYEMDATLLLADLPNTGEAGESDTECVLASCADLPTADRNNASLTATYYSSHTLSFFVDEEPIQVSQVIVLPAQMDPLLSRLSYLPQAPDGVAGTPSFFAPADASPANSHTRSVRAAAGLETSFRMAAYDRFDNARKTGGDELCLSIFVFGCYEQTEAILACTGPHPALLFLRPPLTAQTRRVCVS